MSRSSSAQAGVYSDGLITTRLPAASISTSGPTERSNGKFQGTMLPTTPLGCGWTNARPDPNSAGSASRGSGAIQRLELLGGVRRAPGDARAPRSGRWPASGARRSRCSSPPGSGCGGSSPSRRARRSSAWRSSSDGNGSARNAARWRSTISWSSAIAAASSPVVVVRFSVSAMPLLLWSVASPAPSAARPRAAPGASPPAGRAETIVVPPSAMCGAREAIPAASSSESAAITRNPPMSTSSTAKSVAPSFETVFPPGSSGAPERSLPAWPSSVM